MREYCFTYLYAVLLALGGFIGLATEVRNGSLGGGVRSGAVLSLSSRTVCSTTCQEAMEDRNSRQRNRHQPRHRQVLHDMLTAIDLSKLPSTSETNAPAPSAPEPTGKVWYKENARIPSGHTMQN